MLGRMLVPIVLALSWKGLYAAPSGNRVFKTNMTCRDGVLLNTVVVLPPLEEDDEGNKFEKTYPAIVEVQTCV